MPLESPVAASFHDHDVRRALGRLARAALILMLALGARAVFAADINVNSTADAVDANPFDSVCATAGSVCTLRAAIQQANAQNTFGGTTIHLPAGTYLLMIDGAFEDASATGDLDLVASNGITIAGAGAATTIIAGNSSDRILQIHTGANATISGVSILGGNISGGQGGGIRNGGTATIVDVSVYSNGAAAGGGIYNEAIMTMTGGNVRLNGAQSTPGNGGGIYNAGNLILENATIAGNVAEESGGGIFNGPFGNALLKSVTVASNAADFNQDGSGDAGGIYNDLSSATLDFQNTLIANNTDSSAGPQIPDCYSVNGMTSLGYNLVRDPTQCFFGGTFTDLTSVNPLLGPLADNGGTTTTMALGAGSPAIDAASPLTPGSGSGACPSTDQRGVSRPMDGNANYDERCDIGAFELVPSVNLSIAKTDSPDPVMINGSITYTITVTNQGSVPALGAIVTDPLPAGVVFSNASSGCVHDDGIVTCTFDTIPASSNDTKTIEVFVLGSVTSPLLNTATITGGRFVNVNPVVSATAQTTVSSADVFANGLVGPDPVAFGGTITYTITLGNAGPGTATGVTLNAFLSSNVTLSAATPSQGSCTQAPPIVCSLGTLLMGGTANVTFQATAIKRGSTLSQFQTIPGSHDPNFTNNGVNLLSTVLPPVFTVNSTADLADATPGNDICAAAGGACTLRAAIMEANAGDGSDTIVLPAGTYTLSIAGTGENGAAFGDLDIAASQPVTITGAAAATTIIDGGGLDRVFHNLGPLTISHVTIRNGNSAASFGGGILAEAPLTVQNAIISGNQAGSGGGIFHAFGIVSTVESSTISGNQAEQGGGVLSQGGLTLVNVTVSGNNATVYSGGGLELVFTNTLRNVTIANNSAPSGGGISAGGGVTAVNTIVASNTPSNCAFGFPLEAGSSHNLDSGTTCGLSGTGDKSGQNPLLGPLQNNGGPTPTHALAVGSPAIDAGTNTGSPAVDQRGVARPKDGDGNGTATTDMGAFEDSYPPPTIASIVPNAGGAAGGETVTITGMNLLTAVVTIGGNSAPTTGSATSRTFTAPAHAVGVVDVSVQTVGGTALVAGGYTYFQLKTPTAFSATAIGTQVSLTWNAVSGATGYEIWRSSLGGAYAPLSSPTGTAATDPGLAAGTTYLYRIRAMIGGTAASAYAIDAATTIAFTDTSLVGAPIRAQHFTELRTAVNAMRAAAGLGAFTFTTPTLTAGVPIARLHLTELRTALDAARATAGLPPIAYTDPVITATTTPVKAIHITQLRAGTQ